MTDLLLRKTRLNAKRAPNPNYGLIGSQSVKVASVCGQVGFEGV